MKTNIWLVPFFLFWMPAAEARAQSPYLGVYVEVLFAGRAAGHEELTLFGNPAEIALQISIANEEGGRPLELERSLAELLRFTLSRDGHPVEAEAFAVRPAGEVRKYDFYGIGKGLDLDRPSRLEPGGGLQQHYDLSLPREEFFGDGLYRLEARLDQAKIAFESGGPWSGRGAFGGALFRVISQVSDADRPQQLLLDASRRMSDGDPQAAAAIYRQLVQLQPESQAAWDALGLAQSAAGDYPEAIESFTRFDPSGVREEKSFVPYALAKAYLATGQDAKAVAALRTVLDPEAAEAQLEQIRQRWRAAPKGGG